jgi:uncharacterized membrane protein SirB2
MAQLATALISAAFGAILGIMNTGKQPHILNAASNMLGICFILITGIKLTKHDATTFADEISFLAALILMSSCVLSYISIRRDKKDDPYERWADYFFLAGMACLMGAMAIFAVGGTV